MEVIRLFNPNEYNPHEATVMVIEGKAYLTIKSLLLDVDVFRGMYKDVNEMLKELLLICTQNNWYCKTLGEPRLSNKNDFQAFYDLNDN